MPIAASFRPRLRLRAGLALILAGSSGLLLALPRRPETPPCLAGLADGADVTVRGAFAALPGRGRAPLSLSRVGSEDCLGAVRVLLRDGVEVPEAGIALDVAGSWLAPPPGRPGGGLVLARRVSTPPEEESHSSSVLRLRSRVQRRLRTLFGERASLAEALVLARREALDPDVRESFVASGTAHLLAISGFHVGVVAGILFTLARRLGTSRRAAGLCAALACWAYVLAIGSPDAAARAALLFTLLVTSRVLGRSLAPLGALASAFVIMVLLDPVAPSSPGFQLSFAGAGGLVLVRPPIRRWLQDRLTWIPGPVAGAVASGVAATGATLPLVVWHFGRFSMMGVPATLVLGPLVAVTIPGIFLALVASWLLPPVGGFLGGGVTLLLDLTAGGADLFAALPGSVVWVPRPWLLWGGGGVLMSGLLVRRSDGIRLRVRRGVVVLGALTGLVAAPVADRVSGSGTVEMVFLDVGQGDAFLIRSPGGRWTLVDAGPAGRAGDAGEGVILPYLRRRGVSELALLLLTHPDLDHIGGAASVLSALPVRAVGDPGLAAGKTAYVDVLEKAMADGVSWWRARAGQTLALDGMTLHVLHPTAASARSGPSVMEAAANDLSLVLLLRYGDFRAFLGGDAPAAVERAVLGGVGADPVTLLKVGHHGSRTSTDLRLLARLSPKLGVVSVGRRNRYGHPHREVLERLDKAGARILRTDRMGHVRVRARRDGSFDVSTGG